MTQSKFEKFISMHVLSDAKLENVMFTDVPWPTGKKRRKIVFDFHTRMSNRSGWINVLFKNLQIDLDHMENAFEMDEGTSLISASSPRVKNRVYLLDVIRQNYISYSAKVRNLGNKKISHSKTIAEILYYIFTYNNIDIDEFIKSNSFMSYNISKSSAVNIKLLESVKDTDLDTIAELFEVFKSGYYFGDLPEFLNIVIKDEGKLVYYEIGDVSGYIPPITDDNSKKSIEYKLIDALSSTIYGKKIIIDVALNVAIDAYQTGKIIKGKKKRYINNKDLANEITGSVKTYLLDK